MAQTVWFIYTPSTDQTVDADTASSTRSGGTYDTVIGVWTYDGTTWTLIGCNDDFNIDPNNGNASFGSLALTAGTTYYYQVGSFSLNVYPDAHLVFNIYPG